MFIAYSAPSTAALATSRLREQSIIAFPLIRVTDNLLRSWPVGSLSSQPFFLAIAWPSCLICSRATVWRPPRVSMAIGRKSRP